jgi:hypothetical protein
MKKLISFVTSLSLAATAVAPAFTAAASEFSGYADYLAGKAVIKTTDEAGYRLGDKITRAEMAKVAANLAKLTLKPTDGKVFGDVTDKLGDLAQYIEAMATAGYVAKNANFRPMDLVTRAEMVKMLLKAKGVMPTDEDMGFTDIAKMGDLMGYINAAAKSGIISKNMYFRPSDTASRGEVFKVAANADGYVASDDLGLGDLFGTGTTSTGTTSTGTVSVPAAGDLSVALNPASPASGTQIPKAGIVRFAVVDFKASASDISLNTVELVKAGLASIPTSTRVWFEKNGTRLSGKASFTSENNAVVSFAPAFVVKAGTTESLDLYVELNTTSGNDFQFASKTLSTSAKNVAGSFMTPVLRTAEYSVAGALITVSNVGGSSYNAGADAVEIAKFTVANVKPSGASDTRDEKFQSILLYQSGSANLTNLTDFTVERNGTVVSTASAVNGKMLTLTLNDIIKDGATAIYIVKAKVANVELTNDTYQLYVKNTSDVNVIETASAFRSTITTAGAVPYSFGLYTVTGGDVKFERDNSLSTAKTVAPGTSDVVLMQGTITAKSAVTLEDINLGYTINNVDNTGALAAMNTVYLQIGTSTYSWSPTTGTASFLGAATVTGTAPVKMWTKLRDGASGTIKFKDLNLAAFTTKQYVSNQNNVTSAIGSISGINVTIGATTLNVTRTDGLGATKIPSGAKGVLVYGAKLSSTQGNEIALSNLTATTVGTANLYTGGNTSYTLYVDGVAKSTKSPQGAVVAFDNFNSTVSTTKSVDIQIKADFSDVTTSGDFHIASIAYDAVDNITSVTVPTVSVPGASFTIAQAIGALASTTGDNLVNKSLLLAGATNQKIASFKLTASNDTIKLKTLVLTGANLSSLSNIRLQDVNGAFVSASNVSNTTASFANVDTATSFANSTAIDKSSIYYVVADVNSSTDSTGVVANVVVSGSDITSSNGTVVLMTGSDVAGASHDIAQNTFKLTQTTPTSKSIATNAMEFRVDAFGKNNVTLTSLNITTALGAYANFGFSGAQVNIYTKNNDLVGQSAVGTVNGPITLSTFNSIDAGSSATFVVKITGLTLNASTNEAWTVNLNGLNINTGANTLDAAAYPKNTETFPLTSVK